MAHRYVRVQSSSGQLHYGLLQADRCVQVLDAPPWRNGQLTTMQLTAEDYQLLSPCAPSKIIAVGRNYAKHAAELGHELPKEPLLFMKPPTSVTAAEAPIFYPEQSQRVDYEGELALVIGDHAVDCDEIEARSKIWGYTIANDVTARDLQRQDSQWTRAKGFDSFCPLGPWIVREIPVGACLQTFISRASSSTVASLTPSSTPESANPLQISSAAREAELVQSGSIADMIFSPEYLVAYISQIMTLLPGDVILTGTPEGVSPVAIGDRIRIEIEGIGALENPVQEKASAFPAPVNKALVLPAELVP